MLLTRRQSVLVPQRLPRAPVIRVRIALEHVWQQVFVFQLRCEGHQPRSKPKSKRTIGQKVVLLALGLGEQRIPFRMFALALRTDGGAEDAMDLKVEFDASANFASRMNSPLVRQTWFGRRRSFPFELSLTFFP